MGDDKQSIPAPSTGPSGAESTAALLARVREGDDEARDRLVRRFLPALRRWARGRLPGYARDAADTDDIVQETLLRALNKVGEFQPGRPGGFFSYLRTAVLNQIRDQIRRAGRRPPPDELPDDLHDGQPSPLQHAIGRDVLEAYEAAVATLTDAQREAVFLSLELGFSNPEIAEALGSPSANAARMVVARALMKLAESMHEHR